jgi:hypothetical protein
MIIDEHLSRSIAKSVLAESEKEKENHIPSGKLSASILGFPLQWQILKNIGVPMEEMDEYTLRKFQRGKDVEDRIVGWMPDVVETQKEVEYRGVIGYADAIIDTKDYDFKCGIIPHEIKSVTNAAFKWIKGAPSRSHKLQATLYALALGSEYAAVDYIASDDYRVQTFVFPATDCKEEIDKIINDYNQHIKAGILPMFEEKEPWHIKPDYQKYVEFYRLSEDAGMELLRTKYLESYRKLTEKIQ